MFLLVPSIYASERRMEFSMNFMVMSQPPKILFPLKLTFKSPKAWHYSGQ